MIEGWRRHYNTVRPHGALGCRPPAPEVFVPAIAAWPLHRPSSPWSSDRHCTNFDLGPPRGADQSTTCSSAGAPSSFSSTTDVPACRTTPPNGRSGRLRRPPQLDLRRLDAGGHRAAALYTLIETAKLNGIDAHAWLADVLSRLPDHPARHIDDLLPWNWTQHQPRPIAA